MIGSRSRGAAKSTGAKGETQGIRLRLGAACLTLLLLAISVFAGVGPARQGGNSASAHSIDSVSTPSVQPTNDPNTVAHDKDKTPERPVNMTPLPEQSFDGWERPALRDLAQVLAWPTDVAFDNAGRLRVQNYVDSHEWAMAHIRSFDYSAGAGAAFRAEQEDARIAGFDTNEESFYSYQAYMAVNLDSSGRIVEKRFRWLAGTWILGVDVRDEAPTGPGLDPRLTSEELLSLAVNRGMPAPPSHVPTPNPTWVLPPVSSPTATACSISFTDVPQDYWAYNYIRLLACEGTVTGYNDGTFRPESPTTRAQLAKMLVLSQHWQLVSPGTARFRDVSPTHPFYRYVETAAAHGVIAGYSDGMFRPDAYVTRAQVAKMFVIARGWVLTNATIPVCDVGQTDWAWYYVQTAMQRGLFTGYTDSCFRPSLEATRAQLAKVLALSSRD